MASTYANLSRVIVAACLLLGCLTHGGCAGAHGRADASSNSILVSQASLDFREKQYSLVLHNQSNSPIYVVESLIRHVAYSISMTDANGDWWRIRPETVFEQPPSLANYAFLLPPGKPTTVQGELFDGDLLEPDPAFTTRTTPPGDSIMSFTLSTHLEIVLKTNGDIVRLWPVGGAGPVHVRTWSPH